MYVYGHPADMPRYMVDGFEDEKSAIKAAVAWQHNHPWENLLAVWFRSSMIPVALIHSGMVYRPD